MALQVATTGMTTAGEDAARLLFLPQSELFTSRRLRRRGKCLPPALRAALW